MVDPQLQSIILEINSKNIKKRNNISMKIAIVGLGYVGLPLSLQFARSGVTVLGLDIDPAKVESLNAGRSYIKHITSEAIAGR